MNNMDSTQDEHPARIIRKEFFAYRNGIVADKLRNAGDPHPIIMGCLLVDLLDITRRMREEIGNKERLALLAQELWNDTNSRECRLAAPMLYPHELMTMPLAAQWCQSVETIEISDNLCHKLLRHMAGAEELMAQLIRNHLPLVKYTGYRLMLNLLMTGQIQSPASIKPLVEAERASATGNLLTLLKDIEEEF